MAMTTTAEPEIVRPVELETGSVRRHRHRLCWWCDAPLGDERVRTVQARNRGLTIHTTCVPAMIHDGKIGDYLAAGTVQLDADEI
jgi:hypothetical protein